MPWLYYCQYDGQLLYYPCIITSFSYEDYFRIKVKVSYLSGHYPLAHS